MVRSARALVLAFVLSGDSGKGVLAPPFIEWPVGHTFMYRVHLTPNRLECTFLMG